MRSFVRRSLIALGPDLTALIVFTLLWVGTMLAYGVEPHYAQGAQTLPAIIAVALVAFAFFGHARQILWSPGNERQQFLDRIRRTLRDWLPLIYLVGVYEVLRDYTGIIRPHSIDPILHEWDVWLFGVEPVIWIQRFIHPFWTDYFAVMYMLYFFLPMLVATLLFVKNRREEFRELALSCVLCMYGGYLLYLAFPAGPPRFYDLPFEPAKLTGLWGFYDFTQSTMDESAHVLHQSSFPSLHAALTLLSVLHAFRYGRVWNRTGLVVVNSWIAASIWVATIYLRHHWIVDLFAGWALASVAFAGAIWISRVWPRPAYDIAS